MLAMPHAHVPTLLHVAGKPGHAAKMRDPEKGSDTHFMLAQRMKQSEWGLRWQLGP